jgi:hypothetical protein
MRLLLTKPHPVIGGVLGRKVCTRGQAAGQDFGSTVV